MTTLYCPSAQSLDAAHRQVLRLPLACLRPALAPGMAGRQPMLMYVADVDVPAANFTERLSSDL
jgi:hypothetical protein